MLILFLTQIFQDYDMRGLRLGHELPGKPDYLLRELPKWPDWTKNIEKF